MIDPNIVDDIKQRSDIVAIIGQYVQLRKAGGSFTGLCPFHNERSPSFNVTPSKNMYYCFGCHKSGDVITFMREHQGMEFEDAVRHLGRLVGIEVPEWSPPGGKAPDPQARSKREAMHELHERLMQWYQKLLRSRHGEVAMDYLRGRGLDDDSIDTWRLGYAPDSFDAVLEWGRDLGYSPEFMLEAGVLTTRDPEDPKARAYDRWRHRLMFPIWNESGKVIGFSGRLLDKEQKGGKYVNSPETPIFHKSRVLYGLHAARRGAREHGSILLCEGQMDVIACHRAGLTHACAPQGTAFTEEQARLLKRYTEQIVLCFDADAAGMNAALKAAAIFVPVGLNTRVVTLEDGADPDTLLATKGPAALQRKVESAQDYFAFYLEEMCRRHDPDEPQGKEAIMDAFLENIARLPSPILRGEYCQIAAKRLHIPEDFVFQALKRITALAKRQALGAQAGGPRPGAPAAAAPSQSAGGSPRIPQPPPPDFDDISDDDIGIRHPMPPRQQLVDPTLLIQASAEADLFDIALHHRDCAEKLAAWLPHDVITDSPIGQALNMLLGHVLEGEWPELEHILQNQLSELPRDAVARYVSPDFPADRDPEDVTIAFNQCLYSHIMARLKRQLNTADFSTRIALTHVLKKLHAAKDQRHPFQPDLLT